MDPILIIVLVLGLFIFLSSFFTVKQQTSIIIERFGKFLNVRSSGLQLKIPLIDRIAGRVNLKIQQLDVIIETKTKDNVFIKMKVYQATLSMMDALLSSFYLPKLLLKSLKPKMYT